MQRDKLNPKKFKPIDDNIVFTEIKNADKYGEHILLPETSDATFVEYGEVQAVGPGRVSPCQSIFRMFIPFLPPKRIPMQCKIGDRIFFGRQVAMRIDKYESHNNEAGTVYKVLPESRVLAVYND